MRHILGQAKPENWQEEQTCGASVPTLWRRLAGNVAARRMKTAASASDLNEEAVPLVRMDKGMTRRVEPAAHGAV